MASGITSGAPLGFAMICAALMGYAIQRGGTCMVAALEEVVTKQRASKFVALFEAGLWVAGGLVVANLLGGLTMAPASHAIGATTIMGGAVLGIGALVNRACVFGTIARLGSGDWAFAFTPVGFYLGCLAASPLRSGPVGVATPAPLFSMPSLIVAPLALFAIWRGWGAFRAICEKRFASHIWSPHQATMVIGLATLAMMLAVGSWAYSEVLTDLARGMSEHTLPKLVLFAGLFAGALLGGWTAGKLRTALPFPRAIARCLVGGVQMGCGSVLIPGGNDGLTLVGLPMMLPYAWVALVSMALAIICGMLLERRFARE
jgi:Sulphur transport